LKKHKKIEHNVTKNTKIKNKTLINRKKTLKNTKIKIERRNKN
jgi:hypothetical protein